MPIQVYMVQEESSDHNAKIFEVGHNEEEDEDNQ